MFHATLDRLDSPDLRRSRVAGSLFLLLALVVPSTVQAQGGQQQAMQEWRQVRKQLNQIRAQALQDSAIQARREKLNSYIRSEMRGIDDSTAARIDRITSLQEDLRTAQKQQDTAAAMQAAREIKKLGKAVAPARNKVMKRPEVQKRLKAFQRALRERMREVDSRTDSLLNRAATLRAKLQGGAGGAGGGGGGR